MSTLARVDVHDHAFTDVDAQDEPSSWIGVLDALAREPQYAAYKQRVAELLGPRVGGRYLEVGSGTGADALALERRFGATVVGVDSSSAMVEEARRRGLREATVADAHDLPFPAESFDGAWADRTFQHLADPPRALRELARVTKLGGTIVVVDPDYDTQVVAMPDQELARRVLSFRRDCLLRNGALAHDVPRLFGDAGLEEVRVEAFPVVLRDPTALDGALGLRSWAGAAAERGVLAAGDVAAWESALDDAVAGGWFLYAFLLFATAGRRPAAAE